MRGDLHVGAGEQAVSLYRLALSFVDEVDTLDAATERIVEHCTAHLGKYMIGFGHRFHTRNPRSAFDGTGENCAGRWRGFGQI